MPNNQPKQYGFIPPVIVPEDFWLGSGKLGSVVLNEKGDWRDFLPIMEQQRIGIEVNACVSFAILSNLEMLHKLQYGSEPNYSDRYLAKVSGTDPGSGGNTPNKVAQSLREKGCVPETEWPYDNSSVEEYYKEIPQRLIDMGVNWLKNFDAGYEWVASDKLKESLKRGPISVAVYAWEKNEKGEYIRLGSSTHYVVLVAFDEQDRPIIWDSYDTGLKTLDKNHGLEFPQIWVLRKKKEEKVAKSVWQRIIEFFKSLWLKN